MFDLNNSLGRINFIRQLYNLLDALAAEKVDSHDIWNALHAYLTKLKDPGFPMKPFYSTQGTKRKRDAGDDASDDADSENDDQMDTDTNASDNIRSYGELRKQGYEPEVKPETIVTKRGEVFAPLFKVRFSLLTYTI